MAAENCVNLFVLAVVVAIFCADVAVEETAVSRRERSLVFGGSGQIQVTAGFDLPVMVDNVTVTVSLSAQATYSLPDNASEFSAAALSSSRRSERSPWLASRWQVYSYLEQVFSEHGLSGRACLLRTICDVASLPLSSGPGRLLEEILHILLTPSGDSGDGQQARLCADDDYLCEAAGDYLGAEEVGRRGHLCAVRFPACPVSPLDLLSEGGS